MAFTVTSLRSGMFCTSVESAMIRPPGTTASINLSSEGWFIAIRTSGAVMSGLPMGSAAKLTLQFAVPPRISGP